MEVELATYSLVSIDLDYLETTLCGVALYLRVSSEEQRDAGAIQTQGESLERHPFRPGAVAVGARHVLVPLRAEPMRLEEVLKGALCYAVLAPKLVGV